MCQQHGFGPKFNVHHYGLIGKDLQGIAHIFKTQMGRCMQQFGVGVPYNLEDQGETYLITIPLPGRTKDDVKIKLVNRVLNISASKPKEAREKKEQNVKSEHDSFPWMKRFFTFVDVDMDVPLPGDANEEEIKSAIANGVLKIRITKKPPRDINVSAENN